MFTRGYPKIPTKSHFSDVRCVIPGLAIASPLHDPGLAALQPFSDDRSAVAKRRAWKMVSWSPRLVAVLFPVTKASDFQDFLHLLRTLDI